MLKHKKLPISLKQLEISHNLQNFSLWLYFQLFYNDIGF